MKSLRGLIITVVLVLTLAAIADAAHIYNPSTGSGGAPSGPASGDLGGNYPSPTVVSGAHIAAGTLPNASLVTTPITACGTDINAACTQVTSGAHLGAGTVPAAAVSGWPLARWADLLAASPASFAFTANATQCNWVHWPAPTTFSHICMNVQTTDGSGLYDWGFYNSGGTLQADVGPVHLGSTGYLCNSTVQGTVTLGPGELLFCQTGNSTTGHYGYAPGTSSFVSSGGTCTTAGGQLCNTVTAPAFGSTSNAALPDVVY